MTAPRKPQDHLAKKSDTLTATVGGVEYTIDSDALNDFELLDDLRMLDSGDPQAALSMPRVLKSFLGAEQYRAAMNSLRDPETGRVPIEAGGKFVGELLGSLNPNS